MALLVSYVSQPSGPWGWDCHLSCCSFPMGGLRRVKSSRFLFKSCSRSFVALPTGARVLVPAKRAFMSMYHPRNFFFRVGTFSSNSSFDAHGHEVLNVFPLSFLPFVMSLARFLWVVMFLIPFIASFSTGPSPNGTLFCDSLSLPLSPFCWKTPPPPLRPLRDTYLLANLHYYSQFRT